MDFYAGDGSADSGYDGFYWKKISEKASEGDQCDVWIPDGDVHENKETWKYAHRCCGKLWYVSGLVMIPVTVIVLACVFGKGNNCVGNVGGIVCTLAVRRLSLERSL